jgi:phage terminase small subunit
MVAFRARNGDNLRNMAGERKVAANGTLTAKQAKFVSAYVRNGGNATQAAREAKYGVSDHDHHTRGWELLQKTHVKAEIYRLQDQKICGNLASVALGTLETIMKDNEAPAPARVRAATWVLESAGHGRKGTTEEQGRDEESLSAMSIDKLQEHVAKIQADIAKVQQAEVIEIGDGSKAEDRAQAEPEP